jgi:hypothetical protein
MRVPAQPDLLKVGRTKDVTKREQTLSCGQVQPFRTVVVFQGAGPLEKYVHKFMQSRQVQNEVFRVTPQELKEAVKLARMEYARDQILESLRVQTPASEQTDAPGEGGGEPSNKRRRLIEDIDLEERQMALDHAKAMNALKLEEQRALMPLNIRGQEINIRRQEMDLREREVVVKLQEVSVKVQEAGAKMQEIDMKEREVGIKEREARLMMEVEEWKVKMLERTTQLHPKPPHVECNVPVHTNLPAATHQASTITPEEMMPEQVPSAPQAEVVDTTEAVSKLLGPYRLVSRYRDATPRNDPLYKCHMDQAKMTPVAYNKALRDLGFDIVRANGVTRVKKEKQWVQLHENLET